MTIDIRRIGNWIADYFYIIVLIVCFFTYVFDFESHILRYMWLLLLACNLKLLFIQSSFIKKIVFIYIGYNLFTFVLYSFNGMPISLFIKDVNDSIFPVIFFFIGYNNSKIDNRFYKRTQIALAFCFIVGLFFYLTLPGWYIQKQAEAISKNVEGFTEDSFEEFGRFASFMSSYFTSNLSIVSIIIVLTVMLKKKFNILYVLLFILSSVVMILSQERVAMVAGIVIIILFHLYSFIYKRSKIVKLILIELVLIFISSYILVDRFNIIFNSSLERYKYITSAVSERSDQWSDLMKINHNVLEGNGLGTGGHAAYFMGYTAVCDGNYIKIFYETGIIGVFIFGIMIILTLFRGVKYYRYLSIEITIILFMLLSAIGANIFTMPYIISIFWYSVGRIWNINYLNSMILNKYKI